MRPRSEVQPNSAQTNRGLSDETDDGAAATVALEGAASDAEFITDADAGSTSSEEEADSVALARAPAAPQPLQSSQQAEDAQQIAAASAMTVGVDAPASLEAAASTKITANQALTVEHTVAQFALDGAASDAKASSGDTEVAGAEAGAASAGMAQDSAPTADESGSEPAPEPVLDETEEANAGTDVASAEAEAVPAVVSSADSDEENLESAVATEANIVSSSSASVQDGDRQTFSLEESPSVGQNQLSLLQLLQIISGIAALLFGFFWWRSSHNSLKQVQ